MENRRADMLICMQILSERRSGLVRATDDHSEDWKTGESGLISVLDGG